MAEVHRKLMQIAEAHDKLIADCKRKDDELKRIWDWLYKYHTAIYVDLQIMLTSKKELEK